MPRANTLDNTAALTLQLMRQWRLLKSFEKSASARPPVYGTDLSGSKALKYLH
jgi:hypothetical protein